MRPFLLIVASLALAVLIGCLAEPVPELPWDEQSCNLYTDESWPCFYDKPEENKICGCDAGVCGCNNRPDWAGPDVRWDPELCNFGTDWAPCNRHSYQSVSGCLASECYGMLLTTPDTCNLDTESTWPCYYDEDADTMCGCIDGVCGCSTRPEGTGGELHWEPSQCPLSGTGRFTPCSWRTVDGHQGGCGSGICGGSSSSTSTSTSSSSSSSASSSSGAG